jgi:predicted DNA-binding transcriptional regulator YafY
MYHPTTRLLALLELLQSRGQMSGTEIAERLQVDGRSVRRYILMLQDLGIPIEGTRGPYGGYRLLPGYKLPPLLFSEDEAIALTLGLLLLQRSGLALTAAAVEGTLAKVERTLPAATRERVQALQDHLALETGVPDATVDSGLVVLLSDATAQHRRVFLRYRAPRGEESEREVDPYGVVQRSRYWYLVGYCHLRSNIRIFRLDRIRDAAPRHAHFHPPQDFDCLEYLLTSLSSWDANITVEVVLDLSLERARRIVPRWYGILEPVSGGVLLRTQVDDLDDLARTLLGLGCALQIRRPIELKPVLRRAAAEIMRVAEHA